MPTLITNGKYDEARDSVVQPFKDRIRDSKWVKFYVSRGSMNCSSFFTDLEQNSSHTALFEEPEKFKCEVEKFLY